MSQVHDNIILSYHVDFEDEQLILKTQYFFDGVVSENTDVIFTGYYTHLFRNVLKGSVIFDIEESTPVSLYERNHACIEENRNYCWPILYQTPDTKLEFMTFLQENAYKVFEISASYGLSGWVISREMEIMVSKIGPLP